ncbi:glutathione S-transferase family protein [Andreprevotia chitinilytica]|uniref:glutathione S-transferase family protein n=1 Tax=Andreprevotia chitinilytica TaxID=396808 RepID=UPI00054EF568|nr:glutathione S-transferase [Andreprevotia chitinilytica]
MLKILGKDISINVRKVLWTCRELGLPFEQEQWGAGYRATNTPEYLALNPMGLVPVLIDGDFVLTESNSICRYLANAYGGERLLPVNPRERALVEKWMDWQATELNNAWRYAFMGLIRKHPDYQDAALLQKSIDDWAKLIGLLDTHLAKTGAYVAGDNFSLADIVVGLSVHRWLSMPGEQPVFPAVNRYYQRLSERAGFREFGCNGNP